MKSSMLLVLTAIICLVTYAHADCENGAATKNPEDSDVKSWFKNLGCTIKKGAEDLGETAKPWADKIGTSAKEFGNTVAQKYDEIKHKLTDDSSDAAAAAGEYTVAHVENAPTEKVPLAPLAGSQAGLSDELSKSAAGEQTADKPTVTPDSFDQRFLFQLTECPKGQALDHKNNCRPI